MRWNTLFGDLDAQLYSVEQQDVEREINELARIESSQATLADALRGAVGREIAVVVRNGSAYHGVLQRAEPQWLLLLEGTRSVVIPLKMLLRVGTLNSFRIQEGGHVRHTLAAVLRVLARNRAVVVIELDSPHPSRVRGVIDQVGADFVVVMQLTDGVNRGRENQQGSVMVPIAALLSVMSLAENDF